MCLNHEWLPRACVGRARDAQFEGRSHIDHRVSVFPVTALLETSRS